MGALTHESLVEYLIEEAYEVVESIEAGSEEELRGELGDVLLQVVLHARLAEEHGRFDFADVAEAITRKMIRRNPHVFRPDGTLQDSFPATIEEIERTWDSIKNTERAGGRSALDGIPDNLPALARAQKTLDRAARAGLELPETQRAGVVPSAVDAATEAELGALLFAVVAQARSRGLDAERALRGAVREYQRRAGGTS